MANSGDVLDIDASKWNSGQEILIASLGTTSGLRAADEQLSDLLEKMGFTVRLVAADPGEYRQHLRRWAFRSPLMDLAEAWAVRKKLDQIRPPATSAIIYTTTTAALLEPLDRRRRSFLRFDSLARDNRRGILNLPLRFLELLSMSLAKELWPISAYSSRPRLPTVWRHLPIAIDTVAPMRKDELSVLLFVSGPKKQISLMLNAWSLVEPQIRARYVLSIAGASEDECRSWMQDNVEVPDETRWLGKLSQDEFLLELASSQFYLAAPQAEEYGIAALQALAARCVLITTPSQGGYDAMRITSEIEPRLVATSASAKNLSRSLDFALRMDQEDCAQFSRNVANRMYSYTSARVEIALEEALCREPEHIADEG